MQPTAFSWCGINNSQICFVFIQGAIVINLEALRISSTSGKIVNVLITIVIDCYSLIHNERSTMVFWSSCLDFVGELCTMVAMLQEYLLLQKTAIDF